ncbi:hypothetical protein ES703_118777 [subsurface metagenome]
MNNKSDGLRPALIIVAMIIALLFGAAGSAVTGGTPARRPESSLPPETHNCETALVVGLSLTSAGRRTQERG